MNKKTQVYVVATPIGNMEDISSHAIRILNEVDYIACEDTRVTKKLLDKYKISKKVFAYHKFNEKIETQKILDILNSGKTLALVSDAGTPCVCDPGKILLESLYQNNIKIESAAGPCAISTFLSLVPRCNEQFTFVGFLERTINKQKEILDKYKDTDLIFYESPNRLLKTLDDIKNIRSSETKVAIGRELTKIYEEIKIGEIDEIINFYTQNHPKGEIIALVYAQSNINNDEINVNSKIETLLKQGFSNKDVIKILVSLYNSKKNDLYKLINN